MKGFEYVNILHVTASIQRHCSYLRKCALTLIASDFNQLISHPIQFADFMRFRNQIVRYFYFFAFSICVLGTNYFEIIVYVLFNGDISHSRLYVVQHLKRYKQTYNIISSVVFHIVILAICLRCLFKMRKSHITMIAHRDTSKAKIRQLLFATTTFVVVIFLSFIIELLTFLFRFGKNSFHYIVNQNVSYSPIFWISFGYEGFSGFVVMITLFVWFPKLRPILADAPSSYPK